MVAAIMKSYLSLVCFLSVPPSLFISDGQESSGAADCWGHFAEDVELPNNAGPNTSQHRRVNKLQT